MAIADTITTLGNNIVSLISTRANKDLSNLSATGNAKLTASSASVPVGTVIAYMGTTVPDGFCSWMVAKSVKLHMLTYMQ